MKRIPGKGFVVWGSRTMKGNDLLNSEWKYLSVIRTTLFIEQSLIQGLQWVVFEPNDANLWTSIRKDISSFLNNLYRQGSFQGTSPTEAYFVKCDNTTITQNEIDNGIVNVLVGFAPLKSAEFVIIKLQFKNNISP